MTEEQGPPGAGALSNAATAVMVVLAVFTLVLVALSFPAGAYAVFGGGLANGTLSYQTSWAAGPIPNNFLWVGPLPVHLLFGAPIGAVFLLLLAVYAALFARAYLQRERPAAAVRSALRTGVASLLGSPFIVVLVSIGFLVFSATIVSGVSEAFAGSVGNPFSNVPALYELDSLAFAPLREELGFRVVLIGVVAFVLSMGKPLREAAKSLWRPSAAYEGLVAGGAASMIIWIATGASAVTFGVCHVNCGGGGGWTWAKFPEALWGGVVLGYLYVKYGLHVAVLTHWGIDYLGSVFAFYGQAAYGISASSASREYVGQYLVDLDMVLLFGLACFVLVTYLGVKKFLEGRKGGALSVIDKGPPAGGGPQP